MYGLSGRLHGAYRVDDGALSLEPLPAGAYILQLADWESGELIGVQRVVKR